MNAADLPAELDSFPAVGLADVADLPLFQRFDDKHLVPIAALPELLRLLVGRFVALQVDGERSITYHNQYFDTACLDSYHAHRQGRRRRFKVRTRHYGHPDRAMLEVKCKGPRGGTLKYRTPHPGAAPDRLGADATAFIGATLGSAYGFDLAADLRPSLHIGFLRTTLVGVSPAERLTIDRGLTATADGRIATFRDDWAIVESKSTSRHPVARAALHAVGTRPERVSKYALGVAALYPGLPSNRWRRAQRVLSPDLVSRHRTPR